MKIRLPFIVLVRSKNSFLSHSTWQKTSQASKGVYVPIEETIRGFKAIISGEMDDYPENAFFNVGTIDDVKRAAEKMQASVK